MNPTIWLIIDILWAAFACAISFVAGYIFALADKRAAVRLAVQEEREAVIAMAARILAAQRDNQQWSRSLANFMDLVAREEHIK